MPRVAHACAVAAFARRGGEAEGRLGPSCLSILLCGVRLVTGKTTRSEYCPPSRRRVPPGEGSASASVGPRLRSQKSSSSIGGGNRLGGRSAAQRWIAAGRAAMGTAKSHLVQPVPLCLVGRHLLHRGRARGREKQERRMRRRPREGDRENAASWRRRVMETGKPHACHTYTHCKIDSREHTGAGCESPHQWAWGLSGWRTEEAPIRRREGAERRME